MKITAFKLRRLKLGLADTEEVAKQLNISKSTLYKLEQGCLKPSATLIARIAKVYQCTTDEIYEDFGIKG